MTRNRRKNTENELGRRGACVVLTPRRAAGRSPPVESTMYTRCIMCACCKCTSDCPSISLSLSLSLSLSVVFSSSPSYFYGKSSERLRVTLVSPGGAPAGWPSMGHPAHRKASPRKQFPHALLNAFFSSSQRRRPLIQFTHHGLRLLTPP